MTPESPPSLETLPPEIHLHIFTHFLPPTDSLQHLHNYLKAVPIARAIWIQHRSVLLPPLLPLIEVQRAMKEKLAAIPAAPERSTNLAICRLVAHIEMERWLHDMERLERVGTLGASGGE
jgi:hypothetical protein